jgi:hypothetical protein
MPSIRRRDGRRPGWGVEAVAGIVIEGVFVAMLVQRFFSR